MRYHVPFAHRGNRHPAHRRRPGPVYIGFDEAVSIQRRRGRFNWFGFIGLLLVLVSPLTALLLAPIALLFCLIGLRRAPRGMAVIGLVLSVLATTALSVGIYNITSHQVAKQNQRMHAVQMQQLRAEIATTRSTLDEVKNQLKEYRHQHDFQLPNALDGAMITVRFQDAWKNELGYEPNAEGCIIRSAGPDGKFNTSDDLFTKLDGKIQPDPYIEL